MNPSAQQTLAQYLDALLTEPSPNEPHPEVWAPSPAPQPIREPVQQEIALLEADKRRQLQSLLDQAWLAPLPSTAPVQPSPAAPPAPVMPEQPVVAPVREVESTSVPVAQPQQAPQILDLLHWCDNGRPIWAQKRFEVLLFEVGGLRLAVPLIALGHIQPISDGLTPVFGQADWLMGLQPGAAGTLRVVNTALLVMPERYQTSFVQRAKYIITLADLDWGLAVEAVNQPMSLEPEAVTWRSQRSKRPWLAGTVKSAMCALLDIPRLGQMLQNSDRRRTT